jgi:hypothetical protein
MSTSAAMQRARAYKAIVSLNNAGVSLLQRRLYNEAIDTMKDAIRLMRFSFFSGASSMPSSTEFDLALQAAWKRTSIKHAEIQDDIHLVLITDHDNPYAVYDSLDGRSNVLCCVNIEPVEDFCDSDMERLEAESAMLLYNYGIAHRCAARSAGTGWDRATRLHIHETGFQIFELAQSVAAKLIPAPCKANTPSNALLVSVLVTTNLLQMSSHSAELSWQYCEDLEELLVAISEREMMLPQEDLVAAPAA